MYVQFEDESKKTIIAAFEGPQSEESFPNMGEVKETDKRYLAFLDKVFPKQTAETSALFQKDVMLKEAALRIAPLQDAVDLDDASEEEVDSLKKWKQYRVALNRITQQEGYPDSINWPTMPE